MFSYPDESIRAQLESDGHLLTLDRASAIVPADDSTAFMSVLGPVPIPRVINGDDVMLEWYPFVCRTELSAVQDAAHIGGTGAFRALLDSSMSVNSVFALPGLRNAELPLVRIHSCCLTGDVFGSRRCDCGPQLEKAFERIKDAGAGAVVYMSGHEGRGIGLWAKAVTYLLQDSGKDTYKADIALGLPEDSRDFSDAAAVLRHLLRGRALCLMSNNPDRREQLEQHGQAVSEIISPIAGVCEHNLRYVHAKRAKGHKLPTVL
ncbi:MAG: GTP cyclohydrolase II [Gammaproteobacteria bacterium]|nr:GTP cyclohydrolase II [Gammaproteobacteria bacterium]